MFFFVNDTKQDKPWGKEVIKQNENGHFFFFFLYVRRIRVGYNFLISFIGFGIF